MGSPRKLTQFFQEVVLLITMMSTYTNPSPLSDEGRYINLKSTEKFTRGSYRAAVYEHAVITPIVTATTHKEAVSQMMVNLNEYERQANIAGQEGVDILVFPEDGIYGFIRDHLQMRHYIEDIPDPNTVSWTPCDEQSRFAQPLDVVVFLSCLAKNNSLYLVANYGDAKPCSNADPNCPKDGQYQFNTDLAFDRRGKLVAKYHKENLYYENQFDDPITPEYAYFDTEFGRFGMLTCFDIIFHEPLIPLLTIYNITDIAFPTAWRDVMPYYSAIGYHSSVAAAYHVNLLSANIHLPLLRFQGSGIYTPEGANAFYYDRASLNGKLVISDIDIIGQRFGNNAGLDDMKGETLYFNGDIKKVSVMDNVPSKHRIMSNRPSVLSRVVTKDHLHPNMDILAMKDNATNFTRKNITEQTPIMSVVFKDWFHVVLLEEPSGNLTVCQRGLCCNLEYETNGLDTMYAYGVFNGRHSEEGVYYLQVCLLFACASDDVNTCGQSTFSAKTEFKTVRMSGSFETRFVTPQIILTDNGSLRLPEKDSMTYINGQLVGRDSSFPLLEACLFGRYYERD